RHQPIVACGNTRRTQAHASLGKALFVPAIRFLTMYETQLRRSNYPSFRTPRSGDPESGAFSAKIPGSAGACPGQRSGGSPGMTVMSVAGYALYISRIQIVLQHAFRPVQVNTKA